MKNTSFRKRSMGVKHAAVVGFFKESRRVVGCVTWCFDKCVEGTDRLDSFFSPVCVLLSRPNIQGSMEGF